MKQPLPCFSPAPCLSGGAEGMARCHLGQQAEVEGRKDLFPPCPQFAGLASIWPCPLPLCSSREQKKGQAGVASPLPGRLWLRSLAGMGRSLNTSLSTLTQLASLAGTWTCPPFPPPHWSMVQRKRLRGCSAPPGRPWLGFKARFPPPTPFSVNHNSDSAPVRGQRSEASPAPLEHTVHTCTPGMLGDCVLT